MKERVREISEKTLIPISLVVALLGGMGWLATMYQDSRAQAAVIVRNSEEIAKMGSKQDQYLQTMQSIDRRLSRIEGHLRINTGN